MQAEEFVAPIMELYVPEGQESQPKLAPALELKLPRRHKEQPPLYESEKVPAGHSRQAEGAL